MKNEWLLWVPSFCQLLASACTTEAGVPSFCTPTAPSVVVIVLDDVGRDEVWPRVTFTPTIERFASQGVRFERAYSWPVCSPTRYALNFGRYPRRSGIGDVVNAIDPSISPSPPPARELFSLAEVLAATHQTALFGKWHLGRAGLDGALDSPALAPFVHGFDRWLAGMPNGASRGAAGETHYLWNRIEDGALFPSSEYATDAQCEAFLDWWGTSACPRFAYVGFAAAHPPYDPPPGYGLLASERDNYQQMITYLDQDALARLADTIDLSETYVVIVGDNGTPEDVRPPGSPAGHFKGSVFEGGIRVPLVIAGPGITRAGEVSERLVSVVDLPATLFELLGLAPPPGRFEDSRSFADELSSTFTGAAPRSSVFSERYTDTLDELALVESRWKLRRFDPDGPGGPAGLQDELYDLSADPEELSPLAPGTGFDAEFARLRAELALLPPRGP